MADIGLFVYGTLRVGMGNYRMLAAAVNRTVTNCTAPGRLYYAAYGMGDGGMVREAPYPGVRFNEEGRVFGDLLYVPEGHPAVRSVHAMEFGAGYLLAEIPVTLPEGEVVRAYGYHWPDENPVGKLIESGDFTYERHVRLRR